MTSKKKKKEEIDTNPKKVQDPGEKLKRSPGKFDQRVFMEQELLGMNSLKFYYRLYDSQRNQQLSQYNKQVAELRKRGSELKAQSEDYTYLNALRTALQKEKGKRDSGEKPHLYLRPPDDVIRHRRVKTTEVTVKKSPKRELAKEGSTEQSEEKKGDNFQQSEPIVAVIAENTTEQPSEDTANQDEAGENNSEEVEEIQPTEELQKPMKVKRVKRPVSKSRLATLENLSFEIMTNTLPISKLKRVLPNEELPVNEKWPILSNYRKQTLLPQVKQEKQKLEEDMDELHKKINDYFHCDFPLWQYKYIPKEHPKKYKLLKAVETENLHLPVIPK